MTTHAHKICTTATVVALLLSDMAFADDAGSVLFAKGSVTAERNPAVVLGKGDAVMAADTIATGDASRAQLLMIDGAKIAIRPNSQLRIDEYTLAAAPSASVSGSDDSGVMSLVKGGFRTITGAIGEKDKSDYEVRTAVGVLGIRGTDYAVVFCNSDCSSAPGVAQGAPIEDGLYIGVNSGSVVFRNAAGEIVVRAGEFAFVPLDSSKPELLDAAPPILIDDNDLRFDADGGAASGRRDETNKATGFNAKLGARRKPPESGASQDDDPNDQDPDSTPGDTPKQPVIAIDADGTPIDITPGVSPDPQTIQQISFATGPLGAIDTVWSSTQENEPSQYTLDAGNNLTGFDHPYPGGSANYDIGTASNTDTGFDALTVMRWGRWAGGSAQITLPNGTDASQDLANQSLHWISSPNDAPVMPITGSASYTLIGGTAPTDTLGNVGVLGSLDLFADFTNQRVDSTLGLTINGSTWSATGIGNIGAAAQLPAHLFIGNYNVDVDGISGGSGVFSGFFSEPGPTSDPAYPGGVGITYSLTDAQGATTVSGAAALGNP